VKQLQEEEGNGGVCGYCCCKFSRNTVRQQRHIVQQTWERGRAVTPAGAAT